MIEAIGALVQLIFEVIALALHAITEVLVAMASAGMDLLRDRGDGGNPSRRVLGWVLILVPVLVVCGGIAFFAHVMYNQSTPEQTRIEQRQQSNKPATVKVASHNGPATITFEPKKKPVKTAEPKKNGKWKFWLRFKKKKSDVKSTNGIKTD